MRTFLFAPGVGAACIVACHSTTLAPLGALRPQCSGDTTATCLLEDMTVTENGQPIELLDAIPSALEATDGGTLITTVPPPQITNQPGSVTFTPDGTAQTIELDFADPTGNRPSFMWTLRPANAPTLRCFAPCCFGCRISRRIHDGARGGAIHYSVAVKADPTTTQYTNLVIYPIVSSLPDQDPADALRRDRTGGSLAAAQTTLGVGPPITVPVTFVAPAGSSSGGGSSGTTTSSSGTPGCNHPATCSSDGDCVDFGKKNCAGPAPWSDPSYGVRCDTDGLCHCCVGTCTAPAGGGPATACYCGQCGGSCTDKCATATSTCVNGLGGHPCD